MDKDQIEKEQKELLLKVTELLKTDNRTRNNDLWLCLQYWRAKGIRFYVNYEDLSSMTTPESITRARRIVQNTYGEYLPTDPEVIYRRRVKEELLRRYFAGNQSIIAEWQKIKAERGK